MREDARPLGQRPQKGIASSRFARTEVEPVVCEAQAGRDDESFDVGTELDRRQEAASRAMRRNWERSSNWPNGSQTVARSLFELAS